MNKKKILICTIASAVVLTAAVSSAIYYYTQNESQEEVIVAQEDHAPVPELSEEEIALLREEYPIYGKPEQVPPYIDMITDISLEQAKEWYSNFIYGEIEGDGSFYEKSLSTGNEAIDEKRRANGIRDVFEFAKYTLIVYDDTAGVYEKGEKILISRSMEFDGFYPDLKAGMKVIIPTSGKEYNPGEIGFAVYGMYYVTEDGYAISAFDEQYSKQKLSGIKAELVLEELKK